MKRETIEWFGRWSIWAIVLWLAWNIALQSKGMSILDWGILVVHSILATIWMTIPLWDTKANTENTEKVEKGFKCENCEETEVEHKGDWCDSCNLPERG